MADGEGFIYVNRTSRRARGKGRMRNQTPPPFSDLLQRTRELLVSSGWWDTYRAEIVPGINRASRSIVGNGVGDDDGNEAPVSRWKCLCLGLGRPTSSIEARAQLCLLLDLCAELEITPTDTELFDPAFEDADVAGLSGLGLQVMSENHKGAYVIGTPTLVFMPHCGVELYERFLRANWSGGALARILLVANDLQTYVESPIRAYFRFPVEQRRSHTPSHSPRSRWLTTDHLGQSRIKHACEETRGAIAMRDQAR
ncbi:hypothetical protein FRC10_000170 [Ceratobasidium sp. 414]|nr:hypothetical protein FRC10_000170 [Ceratobasidium sp. 414]